MTCRGCATLLTGPLARAASAGVHVLPFFVPSTVPTPASTRPTTARSTAGWATWDDVAALADAGWTRRWPTSSSTTSRPDSPSSATSWRTGTPPRTRGMFLTFGSVFPPARPRRTCSRSTGRGPACRSRRCGSAAGRRLVWTTFTAAAGRHRRAATRKARAYLAEVLRTAGAAAGRAWCGWTRSATRSRRAGTSSFMTPETFSFIGELAAEATALGLGVLVEVHSYYLTQIEIARQVDRVYDFALPPLVLHALHTGDAAPLRRWLDVRPAQRGDRAGHPRRHRRRGRRRRPGRPRQPWAAHPAADRRPRGGDPRASGGTSRQATGAAAGNLDIYQVNCTFYDALGRRRPALPAGPSRPVLHARRPAGLLRRAARRHERRRPAPAAAESGGTSTATTTPRRRSTRPSSSPSSGSCSRPSGSATGTPPSAGPSGTTPATRREPSGSRGRMPGRGPGWTSTSAPANGRSPPRTAAGPRSRCEMAPRWRRCSEPDRTVRTCCRCPDRTRPRPCPAQAGRLSRRARAAVPRRPRPSPPRRSRVRPLRRGRSRSRPRRTSAAPRCRHGRTPHAATPCRGRPRRSPVGAGVDALALDERPVLGVGVRLQCHRGGFPAGRTSHLRIPGALAWVIDAHGSFLRAHRSRR